MGVHAKCHVLAVDDSAIDRNFIERLLKSSSYQVTVVDSGNKALEFLGLHDEENKNDTTDINNNDHHDIEISLIITDYCMPGITSIDLLRKIKESKNLKDIPVVIMPSENIPARINSCMESGADDFFVKPVRLSDVNKLKPNLKKSKSSEGDNLEDKNKRKSEDECLSPNKSRMKLTV